MTNKTPKISIVTPVYNGSKYIEDCINSILNQNYPNLEYIVVDGGSNDGTLEVIKKYKNKIDIIVSEPDEGIYFALNKGFKLCTGEIMTWLNSDDILHPNSLFVIAELMSHDEINWVTGFPNVIDEHGRSVKVGDNGSWSKLRLQLENTCIQQEGTFWRSSLWKRAGSFISTEYKLAGDFELWNRFFNCENIFKVNSLLGAFRISKSGQLSSDVNLYFNEVDQIRVENLKQEDFVLKLNKHKYLKYLNSKTKGCFNTYFENKILELHSYSKEINFSRERQLFYIE